MVKKVLIMVGCCFGGLVFGGALIGLAHMSTAVGLIAWAVCTVAGIVLAVKSGASDKNDMNEEK